MKDRLTLLDPSHPEALNFNEEQSFKSFGTTGTNASLYTLTQSVSLGGTAFEPQDNGEVDSLEFSIFDCSDNSRDEEDIEDDTDGAFIENMGAFRLSSAGTTLPVDAQANSDDGMQLDPVATDPASQVRSPAKVTRTASTQQEFSADVTDCHRQEVQGMLQL